MGCPNCGKALPQPADFCMYCGYPLAAAQAEAPVQDGANAQQTSATTSAVRRPGAGAILRHLLPRFLLLLVFAFLIGILAGVFLRHLLCPPLSNVQRNTEQSSESGAYIVPEAAPAFSATLSCVNETTLSCTVACAESYPRIDVYAALTLSGGTTLRSTEPVETLSDVRAGLGQTFSPSLAAPVYTVSRGSFTASNGTVLPEGSLLPLETLRNEGIAAAAIHLEFVSGGAQLGLLSIPPELMEDSL